MQTATKQEVVVKNVEIIQTVVGKTFTFVQVRDRISGRFGEGVARKSFIDRRDETIGINMATGRALKALDLKLAGKGRKLQYKPYMG